MAYLCPQNSTLFPHIFFPAFMIHVVHTILVTQATMSETSVALFDKAMAQGLGDEDFSAVFEVDRKAAT